MNSNHKKNFRIILTMSKIRKQQQKNICRYRYVNKPKKGTYCNKPCKGNRCNLHSEHNIKKRKENYEKKCLEKEWIIFNQNVNEYAKEKNIGKKEAADIISKEILEKIKQEIKELDEMGYELKELHEMIKK
jgi:hypothetical protein